MSLSTLYDLPPNVTTRWSTPENPDGTKGKGALYLGSRKGKAAVPLKNGEHLILAQASGTSGMVRRIWMTLDQRGPQVLRGARIDIYWDGASTPAVSAPLADFFGQGLGQLRTFSSAFFSSPEARSFNCIIPMPFRTGFRLVMTNESPQDIGLVFYEVDYTLGDPIESASYFHAHWNRENPTTLMRDFTVLPKVTGHGRYLGANYGIIVDRKSYFGSWWGEGECKMFLDGDGASPTLVGTGTEDYTGSAWGLGPFIEPNQGCLIADASTGQYSFYRYHVPDPIYFQSDLRVVFQQIGSADAATVHKMRDAGVHLTRSGWNGGPPVDMNMPNDGSAFFERSDDWSSCCYFYLDRPENGLPELLPADQRMKGLPAA